jgi:hypothetical protein
MKLSITIALFLLVWTNAMAQDVSVTHGMMWKHIRPVSDSVALQKAEMAMKHFLKAEEIYNNRSTDPKNAMQVGGSQLDSALACYDEAMARKGVKEQAFAKGFYQKAAEVCRIYRRIERTTWFFGERDRCYMGNLTHHSADCTCGHCPKGRDLILMMRLTN